MHSRDMVRMANQIAAFFKSYPHEEAVVEVAKHLKSFWDPRMLAKLFSSVETPAEAAKLEPLVLEAVERLNAAKAS